MVTLRELLAKIGIDVKGTEKLTGLEKQLEGIKNRLELLTAVAIGQRLYQMTERFSKFGEELHVAAQSAGITVEALQKLNFSAQQNAVSQEEMQTSLFRLSRALYNARNGSEEAQKAFAQVGIEPDQIASFKTSQDALYALSDRFKTIQDPIQKSALAMALLGRGSRNMVGYLSQGSAALKAQGNEAEKLGLILGGNQVEALVKVEHALQRFFGLLKAIGATIAAEIAPVFTLLIDDFIKFFATNRNIIQLNITQWLSGFAFGLGFVWEAVKLVVTEVIKLATALHLEGQIFKIVGAFVSLLTTILVLKKAISLLSFAWSALATVFGIVTSPIFLIIAGLTAIVILAHDLYALFTGKQTWTEQFGKWLATIDAIKISLDFIGKLWAKINGGIGNSVAGTLGILGGGVPALGALTATATALPSVSNSLGGSNSANYSINSPININVPPGTPPGEVGKSVKDGIQDHFDRVLREARRSTTGAVAY